MSVTDPLFPSTKTLDELDFWRDPDPRSGGILLSDRIEFYANRVRLISPFSRDSLGPASYTLHAGREYLLNKKYGDLETDGMVEIPPNGLIYIRFFEEVNIPHYLIARFNLRVKQVYRGLLLGTGPQVDPGFRGHLNCPIHNFTAEPKVIRYKDALATIDFEKTTPFGESSLLGKQDEVIREFLPRAMKREERIYGLEGLHCELFDKSADRPLKDYLPPGESVESSIYDLHQRVEKYEKIFFWSAIVAGFGIAGIVIAAFAINFALYSGLESNFFNGYTALKEDVRQLSHDIGKLEGATSNFGNLFGRGVESRGSSSKPTKEKSGTLQKSNLNQPKDER
jgi:deoxycytidine triphosphate deaminase